MTVIISIVPFILVAEKKHGSRPLSSAEVIMIIKCQVSVSSLLLNIPQAALSRGYSKRWLSQQEAVKGPLRRREDQDNRCVVLPRCGHTCGPQWYLEVLWKVFFYFMHTFIILWHRPTMKLFPVGSF